MTQQLGIIVCILGVILSLPSLLPGPMWKPIPGDKDIFYAESMAGFGLIGRSMNIKRSLIIRFVCSTISCFLMLTSICYYFALIIINAVGGLDLVIALLALFAVTGKPIFMVIVGANMMPLNFVINRKSESDVVYLDTRFVSSLMLRSSRFFDILATIVFAVVAVRLMS